MVTCNLDSMQSGFQRLMRRSTRLREDTVRRPCRLLILIITQSMLQMRLLSELVTLIQRHSHRQCSRIAIHKKSSPRRKPLSSMNTWLTRQIWMDQGRHSSIIALAMWWTRPSGTTQAGLQRRTRTQIRIELNTENSSTSLSHSTIGLSSRVRVRCVTRTWPTSQETWGSLASAESTLTTRDLRRLEEDWKTASPLTSITPKNENQISSLTINSN